jgi:SAM-dependent methyltransferase
MAWVDDDQLAAAYDRDRAVPLEALEPWRTALAAYLPPASRRPVLDLGAGTGLFAVAIAQWFGTEVVAVEPSEGMLRQARTRAHPQVTYIGGLGEQLPLRDGCCDSAWLSTVIHHLSDLAACAGELRRVVRPGGWVLVRNAFPDRPEPGTGLFSFWPAVRAILARAPTPPGHHHQVHGCRPHPPATGADLRPVVRQPQGGLRPRQRPGRQPAPAASQRRVLQGSGGPGAGRGCRDDTHSGHPASRPGGAPSAALRTDVDPRLSLSRDRVRWDLAALPAPVNRVPGQPCMDPARTSGRAHPRKGWSVTRLTGAGGGARILTTRDSPAPAPRCRGGRIRPLTSAIS